MEEILRAIHRELWLVIKKKKNQKKAVATEPALSKKPWLRGTTDILPITFSHFPKSPVTSFNDTVKK